LHAEIPYGDSRRCRNLYRYQREVSTFWGPYF